MRTRIIDLMAKKQLREGREITKATIIAETKLTRPTVNNWVNGEVTRFDDNVVEKLCRYFECDLPDLLYLDGIDWEVKVQQPVIYFLRRADGAIKIGTTENFHARFYALKAEYGDLEVLGLMEGGRDVERELHQRFAIHRIERTEFFNLCDVLTDYITANANIAIGDLPRPSEGSAYVRVDPVTKLAIEMIAGELQIRRGGRVTANDALWELVKQYSPEIIERISATR